MKSTTTLELTDREVTLLRSALRYSSDRTKGLLTNAPFGQNDIIRRRASEELAVLEEIRVKLSNASLESALQK